MDYLTPIPTIPKIPDDLARASRENNLVVFIGAGVSRLLGAPLWSELAKRIIDDCPGLNFDHKQILAQDERYDPRRQISICKEFYHEHGQDALFYRIVNKALEKNQLMLTPEYSKNKGILEDIRSIGNSFVTTNLDRLLSDYQDGLHVIKTQDDYDKSRDLWLSPGMFFHLHGVTDDNDSMVLTLHQYLECYSAKAPVSDFLGRLFQEKGVLFVGYGLTEIEILERTLKKKEESKKPRYRHVVLDGGTTSDSTHLQLMKTYYNSLGIDLCDFNKDERGWVALTDVIAEWRQTLLGPITIREDDYLGLDDIDKLVK